MLVRRDVHAQGSVIHFRAIEDGEVHHGNDKVGEIARRDKSAKERIADARVALVPATRQLESPPPAA